MFKIISLTIYWTNNPIRYYKNFHGSAGIFRPASQFPFRVPFGALFSFTDFLNTTQKVDVETILEWKVSILVLEML